MNLYEIKQKLDEKEKAVFNLNEIARIIGKPNKISSVYINRMFKKNLLFKIEKNKISTTDDPFIIASQLVFPSYIGLTTSLYLQNFLQQVINKLYILTPKQKKKKTILETEMIFVKIKPKLMFGYKKIKKEKSFILISDIEKTIIDCILYERYCKISNILSILKKADIKKLEHYLSLANKEVLNRKIGYLLDCLSIKHNIKKTNKTIYKLNPKIKENGKFNNKWLLYINEDLR